MSEEPPSKKRYNKRNPVISFRVSKEVKEKLDEIIEERKTTKKEWFEGIINDENNSQEEAFRNGYDKGYRDAKNKYKVEYPCNVCGEPIIVTQKGVKEMIWNILYKINHEVKGPGHAKHKEDTGNLSFDWGHNSCHEE
ncbi:MAG: hypothetical protein ACLFVB_10495 [Thermoplasmata archaeon]